MSRIGHGFKKISPPMTPIPVQLLINYFIGIKQDLKAMKEITIEDKGKTLAIRSECLGPAEIR
jgi:hypothetical protein